MVLFENFCWVYFKHKLKPKYMNVYVWTIMNMTCEMKWFVFASHVTLNPLWQLVNPAKNVQSLETQRQFTCVGKNRAGKICDLGTFTVRQLVSRQDIVGSSQPRVTRVHRFSQVTRLMFFTVQERLWVKRPCLQECFLHHL